MASNPYDDACKDPRNEAIGAVVTIHATTRFPVDRPLSQGYEQGTGFVVDTDLGLILTNRHIVRDAPILVRALFQSGARQCSVTPYYIDPIHDLAFCKFDVEHIRDLRLKPIKLCPELAQVGREISVVGNDMGLVMSILPGVISRIDCNPPPWDSMINYIQASADTGTLSSGSPVITQDGDAVAMVSGSIQASTDRYLPLDLALHVLENLQSGTSTPRGTIQSTWRLEKPAVCHAHGMGYEEIRKYSRAGSGLLVAQMIIPKGPCDTVLEAADILLTVDDETVTSLPRFEELMDGAVGNTLKLQVRRHQTTHDVKVQVQDLWDLTPGRLLEFAGSVFQDLCYQTACYSNVPVQGVVLSDAEDPFQGSFRLADPGDKLILSLDQQSTPNLDTFITIARNIPDQAKVVVEYQVLRHDPNTRFKCITVDRRWFRNEMVLLSRNSDFTSWERLDLGPAPPAHPLASQALPANSVAECHPTAQKILSAMVLVQAWIPYQTKGAWSDYLECSGIVINATRGFVLTAQAFMPSNMCILRVILAGFIEVPATKVFEHALGFTVIQYDSTLVEGTIQEVTFSRRVPQAQDKMTIYGVHINGSSLNPIDTTVKSVGPLGTHSNCRYFYHPINAEVLHSSERSYGGTGVVVDEDGDIQGLWMPFECGEYQWAGIPISLVQPVLEKLQNGILPPEGRTLDVEVGLIDKCDVRSFGVTEDVMKTFPGKQFIQAKKISCSHQNGLKAGDIILEQGGKMISKLSDLEDMFTQEILNMLVIRNGVKLNLAVPAIAFSRQSERVVWFAGAEFELPYSPVHFDVRRLYSQIFVTEVGIGSPAQLYGLRGQHFVTHVQGVATASLDDFVEKIKDFPEDQFCRLTLVNLQGSTVTVALKLNQQDFKTVHAREAKGSPYGWDFQYL